MLSCSMSRRFRARDMRMVSSSVWLIIVRTSDFIPFSSPHEVAECEFLLEELDVTRLQLLHLQVVVQHDPVPFPQRQSHVLTGIGMSLILPSCTSKRRSALSTWSSSVVSPCDLSPESPHEVLLGGGGGAGLLCPERLVVLEEHAIVLVAVQDRVAQLTTWLQNVRLRTGRTSSSICAMSTARLSILEPDLLALFHLRHELGHVCVLHGSFAPRVKP